MTILAIFLQNKRINSYLLLSKTTIYPNKKLPPKRRKYDTSYQDRLIVPIDDNE